MAIPMKLSNEHIPLSSPYPKTGASCGVLVNTNSLNLAAESGDAESQYRLAVFLADAEEPDLFGALSWHSKSAAQGHVGAKQALNRLDCLTREVLNLG